MSISTSPTFCPRPWSYLDMNQDGSVRVCPRNIDPIGNSNKISMEDIMQGPILKSMQNSIANGQWSSNCEYCRRLEAIGERSDRQTQLENCTGELKSQIDSSIDQFVLKEVSMAWSNLCNLSCNYCSGVSSTTWQLVNTKRFDLISVTEDSKDWLIKNSKDLESIMIFGGEPLLQKRLPDLLSALQTRTRIAMPTNLSVPLQTNPVFNAIINNQAIAPVGWHISFDGIGDRFEYVRHGATWDLFQENLEILKKHNQFIIAHPVYGLYSATALEEYYDFCFEHNLQVYYGKMQSWPNELDIRYAPQSVVDLAVQNIDRVIAKYQGKMNISELQEYRNMKSHVMHDFSYSDLSEAQRAKNILTFNQDIENKLAKTKTFSQLWPEVQQLLEDCT